MNSQQMTANPQGGMPVMAMPAAQNSGMMSIFADPHTFASAMQMADALSKSTIIPRDYQGNPSNCLIAVEMSSRMNASPMMVMQHLFVVNGRPAWSSQWIVAMINQSRKYKTELQYEFGHAPEDGGLSCYAWAIDQQNHRVEGPKITMKMAEAEGWLNKNGSKWKTMPQVMIQYRAASFFGRKNCPDMIMGIYSREEVLEMDLDEPAPPAEPSTVTVEPAGLTAEDLKPITQDQRKAMFKVVMEHFGNDANEILRTILSEFGIQSTDGMPRHIYNKAMQRIQELTEGGNNG